MALLSDGHLLVEGPPGLAKTKAVKALASLIDTQFHRVQFTPDLLPSDLTGTDIYQHQTSQFVFQKGPIFNNIVLADEINRAPAKVQSSLLEAMAERQVTIGRATHPLPQLFMVMATQNPIEQEGTYPLPEAQLDRFLMHVTVDYPSIDTERAVLSLARLEAQLSIGMDKQDEVKKKPVLDVERVMKGRQSIFDVHLSDAVEEYIVQLVHATREPQHYGPALSGLIEFGASPRGCIGLERASRALAWLNGRDYVSPDDVQKLLHDVLRHRILLSFQAEAEGLTTDNIIDRLLEVVAVP